MIYLLITKITKIKSAYRWKCIQYYTFVCSACIDMKFVCLNIQLGYTVPQCEFMINYDVFFPAKVIYHTFGELGRVEQIWVFIVNLKNMFSHFNNKWGCLQTSKGVLQFGIFVQKFISKYQSRDLKRITTLYNSISCSWG